MRRLRVHLRPAGQPGRQHPGQRRNDLAHLAQLVAGGPQELHVLGQLRDAVHLHVIAAELLGGIGLVLPAATRIMPKLTPLAALGLLTVMLLAMLTHVTRGEFSALGANVMLGGLAAFVAWGRLAKSPIAPRA